MDLFHPLPASLIHSTVKIQYESNYLDPTLPDNRFESPPTPLQYLDSNQYNGFGMLRLNQTLIPGMFLCY